MPRRARPTASDVVYHVLNRAAKKVPLFITPSDFAAFEKLLFEVTIKTEMRLLSYCIMPNHWHFVLWPKLTIDLSNFARVLTVTHAQRWHAHRKTGGTGPVYQGRYKSIPVQSGHHFLQLVKYVERNPLRAGLVQRAEDWRWSSLRRYGKNSDPWPCHEWPVLRPENGTAIVNGDEPMEVLKEIRTAVRRSAPYGDIEWSLQTAQTFGLESALKPLGRPKRLPSPFSPNA